jgi:Skp family chaperone for outer membrane proteins
VTLDRDRLFEESMMGRAVLARIERESNDLIAENRRLEAALEAEERSLTDRRAALAPADFQVLAREFDTRVEELRVAQEAKGRALTRSGDLQQQQFFSAAVPVLVGLMQDLGAVAIIDRSAVILSFDRIDITLQAIARLDGELGDGSALAPLVDGAAPDAAPDVAPDVAPDASPGGALPQPFGPQPFVPPPAQP